MSTTLPITSKHRNSSLGLGKAVGRLGLVANCPNRRGKTRPVEMFNFFRGRRGTQSQVVSLAGYQGLVKRGTNQAHFTLSLMMMLMRLMTMKGR